MRILRGHAPSLAPTALTVGNFDGVHRGHQALLRLVCDRAVARQLTPAVLTFEPHPRERLAPTSAPPRLTPLRDKAALLAREGIAQLHILPFTRRIAQWSPEAFIAFLVERLMVRHLIVGDDFRFGAHRAGTLETLLDAGDRFGFTVEAMSTLTLGPERISSSAVRTALDAGNVEHAAVLLGRWYAVTGRVHPGAQLGRQIGVPTMNLLIAPRQALPSGVFVGWVTGLGNRPEPAVINVGVRPTVTQRHPADRASCPLLSPTLEAHLLDWHGDAYGKRITVHFAAKLRNEQRFPSLAALTTQIHDDIAAARRWHATHPTQYPLD
ncbi:bifunctional riboflavin kinase/FAD synthetase [Hydrogenophilus thiooxidans]|uniref:bifunctional riboflavin kinase/FAD synthetase n=1 Tax=Hydrogenophilus thiooxidans TaxID=2820326 RepID=UPI001C23E822|nr:bifunctional riboflavin kinase/FAD synthetase [Hydrogenophilus thiooxidans]